MTDCDTAQTHLVPLEELWLADAKGRHYTSEFRLIAVDEKDGYTHV